MPTTDILSYNYSYYKGTIFQTPALNFLTHSQKNQCPIYLAFPRWLLQIDGILPPNVNEAHTCIPCLTGENTVGGPPIS